MAHPPPSNRDVVGGAAPSASNLRSCSSLRVSWRSCTARLFVYLVFTLGAMMVLPALTLLVAVSSSVHARIDASVAEISLWRSSGL